MKNKKSITSLIIKIAVAVVLLAFVVIVAARESIFDSNSFLYNLYDKSVAGQVPVMIVKSLVVIAVGVIVILIGEFISKIGDNQKLNNTLRTIFLLIGNALKYVSFIVMLMGILGSCGVDTAALVTGASILALIIGLGCQTLVSDIVAGLFMLFEGDIKVGDVVVINGWRGTVMQIGLRRTKIEDTVGNINIINNSSISNIINNTRDLSVALVNVGIEYNESIEKIEAIFAENINEIKANVPSIVEGPFYKGVSELGESSVNLLFAAKCKEEDKYQTERDLNRQIKLLFDKHNINIPFNQVVVSYRDEDEKQAKASKKDIQTATKFVNEQKVLSKHVEEQDQ